MKIRKVLLLVIMAPLLFVLMIISPLIYLVKAEEDALSRRQHIRQALIALNEFNSATIQGGTALAELAQATDSNAEVKYQTYLRSDEHARQAIDRVSRLFPAARPLVEQILKHGKESNALGLAAVNLWHSVRGNRKREKEAVILVFELTTFAEKTRALVSELKTQLLSAYQVAQSESETMGDSMPRIVLIETILFGLASITASFLVGKKLSRRLQVLSESTKNIESGLPLPPPVATGDIDEIAAVDAALRAMESSIRESLRKEKAVIDNSLAAIFVLDRELKVTNASPSCSTLLMKSRDDVIGQSFAAALPAAAAEIAEKHVAQACYSAQSVSSSFCAHIEEVEKHFLMTARFSREDSAYFVSIYDISDAERRKESIRQSEGNLRTVLESMPVALIVLNSSGNIRLTNEAARRLTGGAADHLNQVIKEESTDLKTGSLLSALASRVLELDISDESGEKRRMRASSVPFQFEGEDSWLLIMIDIQSRHEIEMLRQRMIAVFAHDVRTPLTAINSALQLFFKLNADLLAVEQKGILQRAILKCAELISVFEVLLSVQRYAQTEPSAEELQAVDLGHFLDDVVEEAYETAIPEGVEIDCQVPAIRVLIPKERLFHLLLQLLRLLIQISGRGGRILLDASLDDGSLLIVISLPVRGVRFSAGNLMDQVNMGGGVPAFDVVSALAQSAGGRLDVEEKTLVFRLPARVE